MSRRFVCHAILAWFLLLALDSTAQQPTTGTPPFSSVAGGPFDTVNLANLDVHFSIPVFSRAGKGIPFVYNLAYDSLVWSPSNSAGQAVWTPVANWGWTPQTSAATGYLYYPTTDINCYIAPHQLVGTAEITGPFTYYDTGGTSHTFSGQLVQLVEGQQQGNCPSNKLTLNNRTTDGSGFYLQATLSSGGGVSSAMVTAANGIVYTPVQVGYTTNGSLADTNGNTITTGSNGLITDTLGTTALTISSAAPPNPVTYTYTTPYGNAAAVTVTYVTYSVATNFGVSGIAEYNYPNGVSVPLVDKITLPDGSYYHFTYEPTAGLSGKVTGRIAAVTLPTGGTITYAYTGSWGMMADGSPGYMTRSLGGGTWQYWRSVQSGQPSTQTGVTVEDPAGNVTDMYFSGIYQTSQSVYTGLRTTFLDYSYTCYNGNANSCATAIVSTTGYINERTVYDFPSDGSIFSKHDYLYDQYGNPTAETDYNFANGSNPVLRSASSTYNPCFASNICDRPASVQVTDGVNPKSYTTYGYDERGSQTHGSLTSINRSTSGTTSGPFLVQQYSYYSNGTVATATDPNNSVTSYSYSTASASCNYAFPH
jgi:hypothetical protein